MSTLVRFPVPPLRAWHVREVRSGEWEAVYLGLRNEPMRRTQVGKQWLVLDALKDPRVRRGLPIIVGRARNQVCGPGWAA